MTAGVLVAHETRRALRNWPARAIFVVIGVELAWFVRPAFEFAMARQGLGVRPATEQAIAGQVCLFMIANLLFLGYTAFDDQGNGMAARLQMVGVRPLQRLGSKLVVVLVHELLTAAILYLVAGWWFGVEWTGSVAARLLLVMALAVCITALGFAAVALSRSSAIFNLVCYALALGLTAASGGLAPYDLLPEWAKVIGKALPTWWFLRAIDAVSIDGASLSDVLPNVAVILAFAVGLVVVGAAATGTLRRPNRAAPATPSGPATPTGPVA
jgi:ABC-2 type transport system permease protein